jgi:hypothetical protein
MRCEASVQALEDAVPPPKMRVSTGYLMSDHAGNHELGP